MSLKIWGIPLLLAFISTIGLTSALLTDGWGDALSWLALAVPVVCVLGPICRNPSP